MLDKVKIADLQDDEFCPVCGETCDCHCAEVADMNSDYGAGYGWGI